MLNISFRISVSSLSRTERFYRDGLGLHTAKVGTEEDGFVLIQSDEAGWEIIAESWMKNHLAQPGLFPPGTPPDGAGTGIKICLLVKNVDARFKQAVHTGAHTIQLPIDSLDGDRRALVKDPDGYIIMLSGPMTDENK